MEKARNDGYITSYHAPDPKAPNPFDPKVFSGNNGVYFTIDIRTALDEYLRGGGVLAIHTPEHVFEDLVSRQKNVHDRWEADSFVVRPTGLEEFISKSIIIPVEL